jgi:N-sulfoglucosamine sulfohydrolase
MRGLVVVLVSLGLAGPVTAAGKNIVLIVTDDQGRETLGCYGNPVCKTPNLDRLAKEGTRFDNAFCTTASCSPSRSVILSGLHNHANMMYGLEHAVHHFNSDRAVRTLPVLLGKAGYRTVRIGKYHVGPEETYKFDTVLPANARSPVEMAKRCEALFREASDKPFFLYFCTVDPHRGGGVAEEVAGKPDRFGNKPEGMEYPGITTAKYDPKNVIVPGYLPDTLASRAELAQYYQSITRADQGIGTLLDLLRATGKMDDTLIVFVSDHGAPFQGAKTTVYDPGLRVPFLVRHPGVSKRGLASQAMVSFTDITPTLLDFAGIDIKPLKLHGRSLLPILEEEKPTGWDDVFASHTFHEVTMYYPMRVVHERQYKLIWNLAHALEVPSASDLWESATWQDALKKGPDTKYGPRTVQQYLHRPAFELYDLQADPDEAKNLAGDPKHKDTLDRLKTKLKDFQKRTADPWLLKWERE